MIYLVRENEPPISALEQDVTCSHFYEFSVEKEDYFYNLRFVWEEITGPVYTFKLNDGSILNLPSGVYVIICDEYGVIDWIMVDEIIGRSIDVMVLSKDFKSWSLERLKLVKLNEDVDYFLPNTTNSIPICNEKGNRNVIISRTDQYSHTRDKLVDIFVM